MRCAAITALLSCVAMAQPFPYTLGQPKPGDNEIRPRLMRSDGPARLSRIPPDDFAFFEAFPSNGSGTNGVCSTTAPTGAKGETLTFTRATNATCTKTATGGLATTGIADGDLVVLSSGQPRVEYDSNGVLGLLVEESRTNYDQRSEEIDNAWWSSVNTGAAAPTLNGTCATSPLASPGSMPEDYTFPATTAGQQSGRLGTVVAAFAGVASSHSFYVCGASGAGTMDICVWNTTTPTCSACDYPACSSGTWNRCSRTATSSGNVATFIGNNTLYNGGTARSSNRVCVTAAQGEVGAYVTSYIPTTSASATRNAEDAYFATTNAPGLNTGSMAASATYGTSANLYTTPVTVSSNTSPASSGANAFTLYSQGTNGTSFKCYVGDNGTPTVYVTGGANLVAPFAGTHRGWCSASGNGSTVTGAFDSNSMSASGTIAGSYASEAYIFVGGSKNTLTYASGIISRVCRDPDPTRCR